MVSLISLLSPIESWSQAQIPTPKNDNSNELENNSPPNSSRSRKALTTTYQNGIFTASLSSGFHFNEKAPNGIQIGSQLLTPQKLDRQFLKIENIPDDGKSAVARLYVCDDEITFCEDHTIALKSNKNSASTAKMKDETLTPASVSNKKQSLRSQLGANSNEKTSRRNPERVHGFILNDFSFALNIAKLRKQNLLVDFGTRWCPACLRLEKEIFSKRKFQKAAHSFVLAKLDGDVFANSPILEKYNVRGYPTLLFLNEMGEEIFRFYDYQPLDKILAIFEEVKAQPQSIEKLEALAKAERVNTTLNTTLNTALWKRYYFSEQYEKSIAVMETLKIKPIEYPNARVQLSLAKLALAEKSKNEKSINDAKSQAIEVLRTAISTDPYSLSTRGLQWRQSLVEILPPGDPEIKNRAIEAAAITDNLLFDPAALKRAISTDSLGEYTGFERFYVAFLNAEIAASASYDEVKAWSRVVQEGHLAKIDIKNSGIALRWLSAMIQAKDFESANLLVNKMLKADPENGDLQRRQLRILVELKKYNEAIRSGESALKNSYGSNEFFVVEPLAKAYFGAQARREGETLLRKYLEKNEINFTQMAGYKKKLEALLSESEKSAPKHP